MLELNKVYLGNCLDVMKGIEDKSVDLVFTSPPYNRKRNDKYKYYDDTFKKIKDFCVKSL